MKKFLVILFLILTFQATSQADDIRDFEIEGISIGDSLLDYFSEQIIINESASGKGGYKGDKFKATAPVMDLKEYDFIQFIYKPEDKKYLIYALKGMIEFDNQIKKCIKKRDQIIENLSEIFINTKRVDGGKRNHAADKSGESKSYSVYFWPDSGGFVEISCYDWSTKFTNEEGWTDTLNIAVSSKEFSDFLNDVEYGN